MENKNLPALEVKNLSKVFSSLTKKKEVLRDINLKVFPGESLAFLGPNGSGKTTLIKCLVGLLRPNRGSISVFGVSPEDAAVRTRIGYMPERPYYHGFLTGEEFLKFSGRLQGLTGATLKQKVQETLARVELGKGRLLQMKSYSKGMLQRVGLAQALLHDPDLLILDEPMSGLDPSGRRDLKNILREVLATGKTIFFSTHSVDDLEELTGALCFLSHGELKHFQLKDTNSAYRICFKSNAGVQEKEVLSKDLLTELKTALENKEELLSVQKTYPEIDQGYFMRGGNR